MSNVFPILINLTGPFPILGLLGDIFLLFFFSKFKRHFCKQTVENLTRRRVLRRLIWYRTVCRGPTERTLGFLGLSTLFCRPEAFSAGSHRHYDAFSCSSGIAKY